MNHPLVASRSCGECKQWLYDEDGTRTERAGVPAPRPRGQPTPCYKCPKVPKGKPPIPESAVELTDRNWKVWQHYRECKATGRFPDDAIVRQHAAVIREVETEYELSRNLEGVTLLLRTLLAGRGER